MGKLCRCDKCGMLHDYPGPCPPAPAPSAPVGSERRMFPVLMGAERKAHPTCPRSVPWAMLAPHHEQAIWNHSQTLERLAERGGLDPIEMIAVMRGWKIFGAEWRAMTLDAAVAALNEAVAEWTAKAGDRG